jgi:hypothetical protein
VREEQPLDPLDPPDRELAEALARLEPGPVGSSQRQIWYEAGARVGRRRATAVVAVAAGVLLVWVMSTKPVSVERVTYVRVPAGPSTPVAAAATGREQTPDFASAYPQIRDALMRDGLSGLPPAPGGGGAVAPDAAGPAAQPLDPNRWYLNEEG